MCAWTVLGSLNAYLHLRRRIVARMRRIIVQFRARARRRRIIVECTHPKAADYRRVCPPGGGRLSWSARPEAADYRGVRARRQQIIVECAPGGGRLSWSAHPEAADYRGVRVRRRRIIVECAPGGGGFLAERALDPLQFVTIGGFQQRLCQIPQVGASGYRAYKAYFRVQGFWESGFVIQEPYVGSHLNPLVWGLRSCVCAPVSSAAEAQKKIAKESPV